MDPVMGAAPLSRSSAAMVALQRKTCVVGVSGVRQHVG